MNKRSYQYTILIALEQGHSGPDDDSYSKKLPLRIGGDKQSGIEPIS